MILITGASGFLGRAVCARLTPAYKYAVTSPRKVSDLRSQPSVAHQLYLYNPDTVIHLAYPGTDGIGTSVATPADLAHDVLQIDMNVIKMCALAKVSKLITIGSVCSYPQDVSFPTGEDQLFAGPPEVINAPYGHAKRMQLALLDAYRRQYGLQYTQLILSNLYGPGDTSGHVIPATIRKVLDAKQQGAKEIVVWGDGTATREFLYVEDAAAAVLKAVEAPALNACVNICSGEEIKISTLVYEVMRTADYTGVIQWDPSKPNGQPRRQFSAARAFHQLGWLATTRFERGIQRTVEAWPR